MYFQEVKLVHWRNFEQLEITFPDRLIILKGDNAQGKTNLLEALYFLARGVSFRHAKDQELVKRGEDYCLASTRVWEGNTYFTKKVLIRPGHKREWKLNEHLGQGKRGIWLVGYFPTDSEIVDGPPQRRREFLDEAIGFIYPGHEQLVNQYEQILARRNTLLKEHSGGELLDVYTSKLITLGTKIMKGRLQYIQLFLPFLQSFYSRLSGSRGHVHLHYQPAGYDLTGEIEGSLRAVFDKVENEERERGVTLAGPHRDEISFGKEDFDFRYFGSQGEKKTLALSLKMAERSVIQLLQKSPVIVLFDDVFSDLDRKRQDLLFQEVMSQGQIVISTTGSNEPLRQYPSQSTTAFRIEDGSVFEEQE